MGTKKLKKGIKIEDMKNKGQSIRDIFCTIKYTIGTLWTNKKSYMFIKVFQMFLNTIIPLVLVLLPGYIINELVGEQRLPITFFYVIVLILAPVLQCIINGVISRIINRQAFELNLSIQSSFFEHISRMDYASLENPKIQDMQNRARDTVGSVLGIFEQIIGFVSAVISIITMGTIVSTLNLIIVIVVVSIMIVNSRITKWINNKQFEFNRKNSYFSRFEIMAKTMLTGFYFAKENRVFGMFPSLIENYKEKSREKFEKSIEMTNAQIMAGVINTILGAFQNFCVYTYLIFCTLNGSIAIGYLTIYISAVGQFSGALNSVMSSYLGIGKQSLYVRDMMDFMNLPLRKNDIGRLHPLFDKNSLIEFRNVSFRYPGSERYVLKNVNIKIRGNERLCIVGHNGAGKTTFIKLLLRFYFPTEGEIMIDGINIEEYDFDRYVELFSPVFQNFCDYYLSLADNVALADPRDDKKIESIFETLGISNIINQLPKGLNTQLGKMIEDDGIIFSGGEDQKLAIARAIYHNRPISILDEPTAALDPMAEYEIYNQFNNMITDKCAILITHRLSAVQLADKVAVFDDGHVAEYGTHAELYAKGGIYTEMFDKQAKFYRDKPTESDGDEECE